jgi:hypothetical protein
MRQDHDVMNAWWKWLLPVALLIPLLAYLAGQVVAGAPAPEPRTPVLIVSTPTDSTGPTTEPTPTRTPREDPETQKPSPSAPTTVHATPDDLDDDDDDHGRDDDDDDDDDDGPDDDDDDDRDDDDEDDD